MGAYLTDRNRQILFWNSRAERITGYLAQEVIGRCCHDNILMHCDENRVQLCNSACPLSHAMQGGRTTEANVFLRHKQGQRLPVRVHAAPIRDEFGAVIGAAEFFEEWGFRSPEMRSPYLKENVSLDEVTGLPGHEAVLAGFGAALDELGSSETAFGALAIAVDNLEHLRHVYGCRAVNSLLYAAAQTLLDGTRPHDLVGRWREDAFAALVLCPTVDDLRSCAGRLRGLISLVAVPWWGDRLFITVSIGGTMARAGDTGESLLVRAEEHLAAALAAQADSVLVN